MITALLIITFLSLAFALRIGVVVANNLGRIAQGVGVMATLYVAWAESSDEEALNRAAVHVVSKLADVPVEAVEQAQRRAKMKEDADDE